MTSEILAFIQTQANTQPQNLQQTNSTDSTDAEPGLFNSIITELTTEEGEMNLELQPRTLTFEVDVQDQTLTFTGNKLLTQPVIDILTGIIPDEGPQDLPENLQSEEPEIKWENEVAEVKFDLPEKSEEIKSFKADFKQKVNEAVESVKNFVLNKFESVSEDFDVTEIIHQILNDEDLEAITEEAKQKISHVIDEVVNELKNSDNPEAKQPVINLLETVTAHIKAPKPQPQSLNSANELDDDNTEDSEEDSPEIAEVSVNIAGLAGVVNSAHKLEAPEANSQAKPEIPDAPVKPQVQAQSQQPQVVRNVQKNNAQALAKPENLNETEEVKPEERFSAILGERRAEREKSSQNNFADNPQDEDSNPQNFGQAREDFSGTRNSNRNSRTRNDSRRTEAAHSQTEHTSSSTTYHRTESRNEFQSFFEGVLTSRRTASRTQPLPFNLRNSANFTQSSALRTGVVNVVRFIRADGLHRANVIIDPPALGRISVELTSGTSGVEASIKVASEQIRNLIQDQLAELRMNLSQQGVQVAEFTVDVQQDNSGNQQNSQQQGRQDGRRSFIGEIEDEEPEEFRIDLEEGLLFWVA